MWNALTSLCIICFFGSCTVSDRAREDISVVIREANNIVDFLTSASYVQFKPADYGL